MNREEYIDKLKNENFNLLIYYFFIEKSGICLSQQTFSNVFSDYLEGTAIRFLLDSKNLLEYFQSIAIDYFNNKFAINTILKDDIPIGIY